MGSWEQRAETPFGRWPCVIHRTYRGALDGRLLPAPHCAPMRNIWDGCGEMAIPIWKVCC